MKKKLEPGVEIIPDYRLVRFLGRGGFGDVWEATAPGGLAKAIKIAPMDREDALNSRELDGLQKIRTIRHPYLLSIERFETVEDSLIIVMELADKSLADRFDECVNEGLVGIPRDELLRYMREAAEVLDLLGERHGLQHLDIKPENLFLSGGHVKVADFGLVQPRYTNMNRSALAISPPYAAPELFDGRVEPTADQYSLAVTYQELLTGTRPYDAADVRGLILQLVKGRPDLSALPASDRPVITRALQRAPDKRYSTCTLLIDALSRATAFGTPTIEPMVPVTTPAAAVLRAEPAISRPIQPVRMQQPRMAAARTVRQPDLARVNTVPMAAKSTRVESLENFPKLDELASGQSVRASFVAFLPLEIFAFKLRGFIDALSAEIVSCTDEKAVLRFGPRGWLGLRSSKGVFLQLDTYSQNSSGYRLVDVTVWAAGRRFSPSEMSYRGMLLIRCLKSYLMAVEDQPPRTLRVDANLRAEIFG